MLANTTRALTELQREQWAVDGYLQIEGALFIIVYNVIITYIILKVISFIVPLRMDEATLRVGDDAVHGEPVSMPNSLLTGNFEKIGLLGRICIAKVPHKSIVFEKIPWQSKQGI